MRWLLALLLILSISVHVPMQVAADEIGQSSAGKLVDLSDGGPTAPAPSLDGHINHCGHVFARAEMVAVATPAEFASVAFLASNSTSPPEVLLLPLPHPPRA